MICIDVFTWWLWLMYSDHVWFLRIFLVLSHLESWNSYARWCLEVIGVLIVCSLVTWIPFWNKANRKNISLDTDVLLIILQICFFFSLRWLENPLFPLVDIKGSPPLFCFVISILSHAVPIYVLICTLAVFHHIFSWISSSLQSSQPDSSQWSTILHSLAHVSLLFVLFFCPRRDPSHRRVIHYLVIIRLPDFTWFYLVLTKLLHRPYCVLHFFAVWLVDLWWGLEW